MIFRMLLRRTINLSACRRFFLEPGTRGSASTRRCGPTVEAGPQAVAALGYSVAPSLLPLPARLTPAFTALQPGCGPAEEGRRRDLIVALRKQRLRLRDQCHAKDRGAR
jgi:hypothetical protein